MLTDFVNTKQGTASVPRFSSGNTLPLVQMPNGMAAFSPQTGGDSRWYYHPDARSLEGVRLTHRPSPWIGDYGSISFMPCFTGTPSNVSDRWSGYRPGDAVLTPYYMKLHFLRYRATLELTPSERGAMVKMRFSCKDPCVMFSSVTDKADFSFDKATNTLYAASYQHQSGEAVNFKNYIVVKFPEGSVDSSNIYTELDGEKSDSLNVSGEKTAIFIPLACNEVIFTIASSYISFKQALITEKRELSEREFDDVKLECQNAWEKRLSTIIVKTEDEELKRTFYSCMYHIFLFPHKCYELDENETVVHYSPHDGKIRPGVRYTDNGFWDTYRTVYPLYSIIAPEDYKQMLTGFISDYRECGWLPRWISIGESGCMPSTMLDPVICDAAVKGILTGEELETAFEGMLWHSTHNSDNDDFGRSGAEEYCKYGYVPIETHRQSVNLTLDAAYGDWCISKIAEILGKNSIASEYLERSKNYARLFDKATGFMRAKHENGTFRENFDPLDWGADYTEAGAWQTTFAVVHDLEGLASLYGGRQKLLSKLDELFDTPPYYSTRGYGCEIHEMTEMAAQDFGQCAISNQPSFHIPFIYSYFGEVEKTAEKVKMLLTSFSSKNDGFPGDEDNGTMSAWFVFATLGFYPICPGKSFYVKSAQLFDEVLINGKKFSVQDYSGNIIPHEAFSFAE